MILSYPIYIETGMELSKGLTAYRALLACPKLEIVIINSGFILLQFMNFAHEAQEKSYYKDSFSFVFRKFSLAIFVSLKKYFR